MTQGTHFDSAHDGTIYTCPMHPEVRSAGPGDCPKCGMHLVAEGEIAGSDDHHGGHEGSHGHDGPAKSTPTGGE